MQVNLIQYSYMLHLYSTQKVKTDNYLFSQTNPKNIQYLHTQVHYTQLPCKVMLNLNTSFQMPTCFLSRHRKAEQNVVRGRWDSMQPKFTCYTKMFKFKLNMLANLTNILVV